ncbi:MAG: hypothetical protein GF350_11035 [Chitinivibrionales bacterium]|nr:hypothetical protein [Chitinivibrionales bacterium]
MNKNIEKSATPIVLLSGDDIISKEQVRQSLCTNIESERGACSKQLFDPASEPLIDFLERMMTPSLFDELRVFQINHAHRLAPDDLDELMRITEHPIDNVYLFLDAGTFSDNRVSQTRKWRTWQKNFKSKASSAPERYSFFECMKPPEYKIPDWLVSNVPLFFGRKIARDSAEYLIDLAGTELGALYSELQKIDLHLPPKKAIDLESIDTIVGASRTTRPYELARALGEKDMKRTMEIIDGLFSSTFYPPLSINAIFRHFWGLFRIRKYAESHPREAQQLINPGQNINFKKQNEVALKFGVASGLLTENQPGKVYPVIIKSGIVKQARLFKERHHKKIFSWLQQFDIDSKTGRIDPDKKAFELLCYKILRVEELEQAE